jgi:hypothetical protein
MYVFHLFSLHPERVLCRSSPDASRSFNYFFSQTSGFLNLTDLPERTVLKLCASAEHVWVSQDQQGLSAFVQKSDKHVVDMHFPSDSTRTTDVDRCPDLGVLSP